MLCLLAAVASFAFHVRPLVFRSGSMGPQIQTGALGLARQVPATSIRVGDVVSVPNARGVRVTHRVRTVDLDGPLATLVLQGDANPVPDAEPYVVSRADRLFVHVNRLGYVVTWLGHRPVVFAGGVLVGLLGAYVFRPSSSRPAGRREGRRRAPDAVVVTVLVVAVGGTLLAPRPTGTMATFVDAASATSGTFASRTWRCDTAVLADAPRIFYELDETSTTTTAQDSSGNARAGTYQGAVTKGVASPCTRDGGTAVTFAGTARYVSLGTALSVPTAVSVEAWFKTNSSNTSGFIVGFGASATGASASTDRVVYMASGGRMVFGVNNQSKAVAASTATFNDNAWHHVLATAGTAGLRVYVDGTQVATSASTATAAYGGNFRVGYDSLTGWTPAAGSSQFLGSVDGAAVYSTTLTAADAAEHYRAAT